MSRGSSAVAVALSDPSDSLALAVIYLRVSTHDQTHKAFDAEGYSIPVQRETCTRYAALREAKVVAEFVDYGESARTVDRPDLQRLLKYISEHPVKYVIFYDVSRLARNELDAFQLLDKVDVTGGCVHSATENIDTSTTAGRLTFGVLASTAAHRSRGEGEGQGGAATQALAGRHARGCASGLSQPHHDGEWLRSPHSHCGRGAGALGSARVRRVRDG